MSTATVRAAGGRVEGERAATAVLEPVVEGRPGTAVPVEAPVGEPAEPAGDSIEDRVRRGALLLDATTPGGAAKVNGDRLAMRRCDKCLLGQLYGDYNDGLKRIGLPLYLDWDKGSNKESDEAEEIAAAHGFTMIGWLRAKTNQDTDRRMQDGHQGNSLQEYGHAGDQ